MHQSAKKPARGADSRLLHLTCTAAWLRYRWARKRLVERSLHRMGASRKQSARIARHVP